MKTNEVDMRSTSEAKTNEVKKKPNHKKVKNDPGKWGIFFETESLVGPRLEVSVKKLPCALLHPVRPVPRTFQELIIT